MPIRACSSGMKSAESFASRMFCAHIILIQHFELADLGLLLRVSANHAHAREILLDAAADVGEHLLDRFEAIVNAAAEEDHRNAHQRRRESGRTASAANPPAT